MPTSRFGENVADEAFMVIARGLWRYYEEALGDTPARVTTVVLKSLEDAGFKIVKEDYEARD